MLRRVFLLLVVAVLACPFALDAQDDYYYVLIKTNMGNMRVRLYNETPEHRKVFLQLANSGHYNGTLFYRVIKNFVVQGGSSDSRKAPVGKRIGYGESYNISSEFVKDCFHKKGALCAPRQPESVNHFKMSDIAQFYIVHGRVYTDEELDKLEKAVNNPILKELRERFLVPHKEELDRLREEGKIAEYNELARKIKSDIEFEFSVSKHLKFTPEQRKAYTTVGGIPQLDGDYTVFGEVIEGLDVLDKIAALETDKNDRPLKDVIIISVEESYR